MCGIAGMLAAGVDGQPDDQAVRRMCDWIVQNFVDPG